MENQKPRVAIVHGDTNGTGYELIFKVFAEPEILELCTPIIYGSPKVAAYHLNALGMQVPFATIKTAAEAQPDRVNLLACIEQEINVELGVPTELSNVAAAVALDRAVADYRDGAFDVLVTAPVADGGFEIGGTRFANCAAYVESCLGEEKDSALDIVIGERMRVAVAAEAAEFADVPKAIAGGRLAMKLRTLCRAIKADLRIYNPRVAVLALNGNPDGPEERETIAPAIDAVNADQPQAFGPYRAEDLFGRGDFRQFDVVLAMYHDQAHVPFRAIEDAQGVKLTTGLPLVCATCCGDAAFELAGRGEADEAPLRKAIYVAIDVWRNRAEYELPYADPLKKLYHERREDGERRGGKN